MLLWTTVRVRLANHIGNRQLPVFAFLHRRLNAHGSPRAVVHARRPRAAPPPPSVRPRHAQQFAMATTVVRRSSTVPRRRRLLAHRTQQSAAIGRRLPVLLTACTPVTGLPPSPAVTAAAIYSPTAVAAGCAAVRHSCCCHPPTMCGTAPVANAAYSPAARRTQQSATATVALPNMYSYRTTPLVSLVYNGPGRAATQKKRTGRAGP
jgi:hypothetical protein